MRSDRRLHSEPTPPNTRASCAPGAETVRLAPERAPLVPRLAPRARSRCAPLAGLRRSRSPPYGESACTEGLGAHRCGARPGIRALHDARIAGRAARGRVGECSSVPRARIDRALGVSVASSVLDRSRRTDRGEKRRPPRSNRRAPLVKEAHAPSTRDAFHRREPRTRRARAHARTRATQPPFRSTAHVMRIARASETVRPFTASPAEALTRSDRRDG